VVSSARCCVSTTLPCNLLVAVEAAGVEKQTGCIP